MYVSVSKCEIFECACIAKKLYFRLIIANPFKLHLNFITSQLQKQISAMNVEEEQKSSLLMRI
jgi:hypothetical protein